MGRRARGVPVRAPAETMVSEFDLPCTACGHELVASTVASGGTDARVTVAECPNCGTRHYPESALEGLRSRR